MLPIAQAQPGGGSLAALLCLALWLLPSGALARHDMFSVPSSLRSGGDTSVVFNNRNARVEWGGGARFEPPYGVVLTSRSGDTLFCGSTGVAWCAVAADAGGGRSRLRVTDAAGRSFSVRVSYAEPPSAWWAVAAAAAVLAAGGLALRLALRRQRRALERKGREMEAEAGKRRTRKYDFATVLFTDIQGFTKIAEHMNPEKLVDELDRYFIYFDELVDKYNVEKIKTIGDAYMCAGGVPDNDSANPIEVVLVGLEMIAYVSERRARKEGFWNIRVGVNTGPVISGHLGNIKKVFDIWGDTVNTASRMESGGEPGRVNVSESTYQRIRDFFDCEYRGKMPVKYKGEVDMYFVNGLKAAYCQPGAPHKPNALLLRKLQVLRIQDFEQSVRQTVLKDAHPNASARMDAFLTRVRTLASLEAFSDDELIVSGVAAIFCFVNANFPKAGLSAGGKDIDSMLGRMHLTDGLCESIRGVAVHAEQGKAPEGRVEEVISDAFNEVYGRKDVIPLLLAMYGEAQANGGHVRTRSAWLLDHKAKAASFTFYTDSARRLCEVPKAKQVEAIGVAADLI